MSKIFFYILFSWNNCDTSLLSIYNDSKRNYYILLPRSKKLFVSKEYPDSRITFLKFDYYRYSHSQGKEIFKTRDELNYDTVFIEGNSYKYIKFKSIKNDSTDSIPIQHLFKLKLISKNIGIIHHSGKKYFPLRTKKTTFFDYRNFTTINPCGTLLPH